MLSEPRNTARAVLLGTEKAPAAAAVYNNRRRTTVYDVAEFDAFSVEALMALIELRRAAYARLLAAEAAAA